MHLLLIGVSYKTASLEIRERFAINPEGGQRMLERLLDFVRSGVVLATCNRTEIYTTVHDTDLADQHLKRFLIDWSYLPLDELQKHTYSLSHQDAIKHLFRVASGLESMILGEDQVLGQVKEAMEKAQAKGALDPILYNLFRQAIRTGKRARTYTGIGRHPVSVSSAAVAMAREFFGGLENKTVLVISAGEAGKLAGKSLVAQGARLLVTNRTQKRAESLAKEIGGRAVPFDSLNDSIWESDIIISSTGAPQHVLTKDVLAPLVSDRSGRPLFIVDIAVPRDVEPAASDLPNVVLRNIDDLQSVADASRLQREMEVSKVDSIIENDLDRFLAWWRTLGVVPTIAALREQAESIRQSELERTIGKLNGISEADAARIEAMTKSIVKKLLHQPMTYLKSEGNSNDYVQAVQKLFDLKIDSTVTGE